MRTFLLVAHVAAILVVGPAPVATSLFPRSAAVETAAVARDATGKVVEPSYGDEGYARAEPAAASAGHARRGAGRAAALPGESAPGGFGTAAAQGLDRAVPSLLP